MKNNLKYLKLLFCLPFLYMCLSFNVVIPSNWKTLVFPPSDASEEITFEVTYERTMNEGKHTRLMNVSLKNKNYPNKTTIFQGNVTFIHGFNIIKRVFTIYPHMLSQGENILTLAMIYGTDNDSLVITTFLKTHETFDPSSLNNGVYESPKNDVALANGLLTYQGDTIHFQNFDLFVEDEYYSYLKLDKFRFTYDGDLKYQNVFFLIEDNYSFYHAFSKYLATNYRQIPLKIKKSKQGFYSFAFKNPLFIDLDTYLMSPVKRKGFIETSNFYFPKERFDTQQNIKMAIVVENCGFNDLTIDYNFTYYSNLAFIGNCLNSKYCINTSSPKTNTEDIDFQEVILC